jgi:hypothetical protein
MSIALAVNTQSEFLSIYFKLSYNLYVISTDEKNTRFMTLATLGFDLLI